MSLELERDTIGMVLGTEDATPLNFWFAVSSGVKVQLDDIIYIEVSDPSSDADAVRFYGVVDEVRRRFEGVQFDGDTELVAQGLMPANVAYTAHVLVTRVEPEEFIPPNPGDSVFLAGGEALAKALYIDNMDVPLPAGVLRNNEVGYLNFDFINGTKGAHINISGISGIATKTSYALFLLYSIFNAENQKTRQPIVSGTNTKAIIFNVKGEDLLFLDKPNARYAEEEGKWRQKRKSERSRYEICGLPETEFASVGLHAPAMEGEKLLADVKSREGVAPYLWTLHEFANERMLPFVLSDRDAMSNLGFLVSHVEEKLAKLAEKQKGPGLFVAEEQSGFSLTPKDEATGPISEDESIGFNVLETRTGKIKLETFDHLVTYLEYKLLLEGADDDDGKGGGDRAWTANQAKATREAFIRRMRGAAKHVRRLIRGDLPKEAFGRAKLDILDAAKQVHVVDIHQLPPLAQMFTVGVLLKQVFNEQETRQRGQVFIVLDELNKYAPAEGDSPIKEVLLDIAERGRSMGIILIGAQQTASEVERRIVSNAAVRIVGRLDAAEAERSEYRFMPGSFRMRATILAPGTMIVHQPDVPSPLMLNFPFPSWATRKKEWHEDVSDQEAADVLG
ncbi:MAG: ATP-binding protein [Trueperaceae bacterium]|nr:ATP-binding protein [Trueperaceae bacterium]